MAQAGLDSQIPGGPLWKLSGSWHPAEYAARTGWFG